MNAYLEREGDTMNFENLVKVWRNFCILIYFVLCKIYFVLCKIFKFSYSLPDTLLGTGFEVAN